jgi:multidrug efflux pump subunit AcrA (membrane-fusion protein)
MMAIGVAVVPIVVGGGACSRTGGDAPQRHPTVSVVKVTRGDLSQTVTLAAEFRPFQEVECAKSPGT